MKNWKTWFIIVVVASILGCVRVLDPITGEQALVIAPGAVVVIDTAAEAAPNVTLNCPPLWTFHGITQTGKYIRAFTHRKTLNSHSSVNLTEAKN